MAIKLTDDNPTTALLIPHFVVLLWKPENSHVHQCFCTFGSDGWRPRAPWSAPLLHLPSSIRPDGSVGQGRGPPLDLQGGPEATPFTSRPCARGHEVRSALEQVVVQESPYWSPRRASSQRDAVGLVRAWNSHQRLGSLSHHIRELCFRGVRPSGAVR